jgi:hypothetical protein
VAGLTAEVVRLPGRTPVLFFEIAATRPASPQTVLMYGHLDKQPEFSGWRADLGPGRPSTRTASSTAAAAPTTAMPSMPASPPCRSCKRQGVPHPRIVGLIETCEESGSRDLLPYIDALKPRLGDVGLVVCLDSGAGNYDQLWLTTSLRGMASGTLKVEILTEGIHSGDASGLVPSFPHHAPGAGPAGGQRHRAPAARASTARCPPSAWPRRATAAILGEEVYRRFPGRTTTAAAPPSSLPAHHHRPGAGAAQAHLGAHAQRDRRRGLSGPAGRRQRAAPLHRLQAQPAPAAAGGRRSLRAGDEGAAGRQRPLPGQGDLGERQRRQRLERAETAPWFAQALDAASQAHFGAPCGFIGQGGTIPLMNMLRASRRRR